MSRRAVRTYIGTLATQATPPLTVWNYVPVDQPIEDLFVIVGMTELESADESTMPTGGAYRMVEHVVTCQIMTVDVDEGAVAVHKDDLFQGLVSQLRAAIPLNGAPIAINDAIATPPETSYVTMIGSAHNGRPGITVLDDWTETLEESDTEGMKLGSLMIEVYVRELIRV